MGEHDQQAREALARKQNLLVPCVYHFYRDPPLLVRGEGVYLEDVLGRRYLDMFSGVSVNHLGHAHPRLVAAIKSQVEKLSHTTTIYLTTPMLDLAEKLLKILPDSCRKIFFCASGSEANEAAVLFARRFHGKPGIAALEGALHGSTLLTLSLTGLDFWKRGLDTLPEVRHIPAPYCYRCPVGKEVSSCRAECAEPLVSVLKDKGPQVGSFILEIIQGNGGVIVGPSKYYERVADICRHEGVVLIVDEVQTGLGRTGRLFASDHFGLQPDALTLAKSLGGGLPLGAVAVSRAIAKSCTAPRASTFGGNLVACAAGGALIDTLRREGIVEHVAEVGRSFKQGLLEIQREFSAVGEVRGLGLMLGVELVGEGKKPAPKLTDRVLEELKEAGILAGKSGPGRNVLTFLPPLIVEAPQVARTLKALKQSLSRA